MTSPQLEEWPPTNPKYRRSEASALVGHGDALWERVRVDVMRWRVKTASGFCVKSAAPAAPGDRLNVTVHVLGMTIIEPVEVTDVVIEHDRVGFSYRTRPGHPVSGEGAFIVHRQGDAVYFTVRSLTRAAPQQPWRALYPFLLVAQRIVRRRYLRALR